MKTVIFDGLAEAGKREKLLRQRVGANNYSPLHLVVFVFAEDQAGQIYARLKGEAAERVGIRFERIDHSIQDNLAEIAAEIRQVSLRPEVTGVMIQKPAKKLYGDNHWWETLTAAIEPKKDVDCLTQTNLDKVYDGEWQILPATVKAILNILEIASRFKIYDLRIKNKAVIIGRSEIVGRPLAAVLAQKGFEVDLLGSKTEDLEAKMQVADLVVSATGIKHLIKGEWIKPGAVVIDVGSPNPEVEFEVAKTQAGFITPVPYGVGPMTVVSLLENILNL